VAKEPKRADEPELMTLVSEVVGNAETLIGEHLDLLRSEMKQELRQARDAALSMGAGATLVAAGGVLTALMTVHALHRATRLPLWASYGLVGGLVGGVGMALLSAGGQRAASLSLVPEQTVEALKENLAWAKDQVNPQAT
jgi:hypothetical protein